MSIINTRPLAGASGNQVTGYNLTKSLRFRASASASLTRTYGTPTNSKIYTFSFWVKRGKLGANQEILNGNSSSSQFYFQSNDTLNFYDGTSGAEYITTQVFRDTSAWYHIVVAMDTTQATAGNRTKIYVNGVQVTSFGTATAATQNTNSAFNVASTLFALGVYYPTPSNYFDGYLTEVNFIDGQALTPSSFGETDTITGVWKPKRYTGTYGTNGFYLSFTDVATTSGSNAGLGKDFSGNGNYWNTNNISVTAGATYDSMTDVPTLTSATTANYAVLNPVAYNSSTISDGNLLFAGSSGTNARTTFAMPSSGSFYWEVTPTTTMPNYVGFGLLIDTCSSTATAGSGATGLWGIYPGGTLYTSINSTITNTSITTPALGCTFAVAYDCATGKAWFGYAASGAGSVTWIGGGSPSAGTSPTTTISTTSLLFAFLSSNDTTSNKSAINFGQRPLTYTPPSGFVALNTYNLPDSTIVAGNKVMDATTYTGTTAYPQTITNAASFKPDFVWAKSRSNAQYNGLFDSVRSGYALYSNATDAEDTTEQLTFNSNGFSTPNKSADFINTNGYTYVGWQWQAGQGTTSSNTSGSITSTVSVNASAGFSIVTYTGTGSTGTVGHGLGVAPKMIISKNRSAAEDWRVAHTGLTNMASYHMNLNGTGAQSNSGAAVWNNTTPTSTIFGVGTDTSVSGNGNLIVAYCWSEIAGFSKFSSYVGNGSSDGVFVYTGFQPKFVMIKCSSAVEYWYMYDSVRNTYNVVNHDLIANLSNAEGSTNMLDFTSNGFKIRNSASAVNSSGATYIYAAFASNPFRNSLAF